MPRKEVIKEGRFRPEVVSLKELWPWGNPNLLLNEEMGTRRPDALFLNHFFFSSLISKARGMPAISLITSFLQSPKTHLLGTHYVPGIVLSATRRTEMNETQTLTSGC